MRWFQQTVQLCRHVVVVPADCTALLTCAGSNRLQLCRHVLVPTDYSSVDMRWFQQTIQPGDLLADGRRVQLGGIARRFHAQPAPRRRGGQRRRPPAGVRRSLPVPQVAGGAHRRTLPVCRLSFRYFCFSQLVLSNSIQH